MPLTAVATFAKFRNRYKADHRYKTPTLKASTEAAKQMGKGPYFARKICGLERYLLKFQRLPERESAKKKWTSDPS